jgi:hypothetical protein
MINRWVKESGTVEIGYVGFGPGGHNYFGPGGAT